MELTPIAQWLNSTFYGVDLTILAAYHQLALTQLNAFLQPLCHALGWAGKNVPLLILLCAALVIPRKTRTIGLTMSLALIIGFLVAYVGMKSIIARPRPYATYPDVMLWWQAVGSWTERDYSFPSGHAMASAALLSGFFFARPSWKSGTFAGVFIALMCFSRNYLMVHYPSDVFAGALIGILAGWVAWTLVRKLKLTKV